MFATKPPASVRGEEADVYPTVARATPTLQGNFVLDTPAPAVLVVKSFTEVHVLPFFHTSTFSNFYCISYQCFMNFKYQINEHLAIFSQFQVISLYMNKYK